MRWIFNVVRLVSKNTIYSLTGDLEAFLFKIFDSHQWHRTMTHQSGIQLVQDVKFTVQFNFLCNLSSQIDLLCRFSQISSEISEMFLREWTPGDENLVPSQYLQ